MLETNLESRHFGAVRKATGRRRLQTLWVLVSLAALVALFPVCLAAQTASLTSLSPTQGSAYGTGAQTPLRFQGEPATDNQVSLSMGVSAFYDDNVLARNALRVADEAVSFSSLLDVEKQTSNMVFSFDYLPFFLLYRKTDQYDRLNHAADLSLAYRLSPRLILGLHDTFSYQNGILPSFTGQPILSGPPPPTNLNQGIFSYTTRAMSNVGGVDLTFVKSRRNSLTLSAGYNQLKFGSQTGDVQTLYNGLGGSAGLQYQHRVSDHTTFGLLFLHQDTTYKGGQAFGNRVRTQIESTYVSVGSRLTPTVTVTLYGGPQYVHVIGAATGETTIGGSLQGSGGGSITVQSHATAFNASFQRSVSDSGGLYTSVINTNGRFGARRHLTGRWDVDLHGGLARADASLFLNANAATDAVYAGIEFSRPIREFSKLHISYDTTHQVSNGTLPIFSDFDRNQVTIGIDFRVKAISLGQ